MSSDIDRLKKMLANGTETEHANFMLANLERANLEGVQFNHANLDGAKLMRANLVGAKLEGAQLEGANLMCAQLRDANLKDANLVGANLVGANLVGAQLRDANLEGAQLRDANLVGAQLRHANLVRAKLSDANLEGANLVGANLMRANLMRAQLRHANLVRANLVGANLERANLEDVQFNHANLMDANLEGANLMRAELTQSQLDVTNGNSKTLIPKSLIRPDHWDSVEDEIPTFETPDINNFGDETIIENNCIKLSTQATSPNNENLKQAYDELLHDVSSFKNVYNIGNSYPAMSAVLSRIKETLPEDFTDLKQIAFGIQFSNLVKRLNGEREEMAQRDPDILGNLDAIAYAGNLIVGRLPIWHEFLSETGSTLEKLEENEDTLEELFEDAASKIEADKTHFDVSILNALKEYINDATMYGYVASTYLISNIAHTIFDNIKPYIREVLLKTREVSQIYIAHALITTLRDTLYKLKDILGEPLSWVTTNLDILIKTFS